MIEYKLVSSYHTADFVQEINKAAAQGWTIYSWHVTDDKGYFAMMERQKDG